MRWLKPVKYDHSSLSMAHEKILTVYRDRGYLDVRVEPLRKMRDKDGNVVVEAVIHEGPQYHVGRVQLGGSGLGIFPESVLMNAVKLTSGAVASEKAIRDSANALRDVFGVKGYVNTMVNPVKDVNPSTGIANLRYNIREGTQAHIRNIVIQGNARTRDKVLRRELLVSPGDLYNEVKVRRSEGILTNLGFFSSVRAQPLDTRVPGQKDLLISVQEKRTGQFMVGAGFSSIDRLTGFLEISQGNFDLFGWPNFTGGGQKLKLHLEAGTRRKDLSLSFIEPWFLDRKLSLGVDLYNRELDYTDYDVKRVGTAVSIAKPLPGPNRIRFTYRLESKKIQDIADTNRYVYLESPTESYYFTEEENYTKSSLRVSLRHDTRNHPFLPSRGNRVSVFSSLAGGPLGFDTDLYGMGFRSSSYVSPWFHHVISLRMRYEIVNNYGGTDEIPIDDRLYIGGGRTVRGYEYRGVGPKVVRADRDPGDTDYRPVGGKTLAMASVEYTIPIVKAFRIATFFDIGNVWRDAYDTSFANMASGAGIGIRLDMPGFPIKIDRAWAVSKDSEFTDEDKWVIWIGNE